MASELKDLIAVSRLYGADPAFVVAGGGNTSYKLDGTMWVKASGVALDCVDESGFVEMDLRRLRDLVKLDFGSDTSTREAKFVEEVLLARLRPELGQRPSVECVIHALFPKSYVVHTHPTRINQVSCCKHGKQLAAELWGDQVRWVDYTDPGITLAKRIAEDLDWISSQSIPAMIWQNHGLIVAANTTGEIQEFTSWLVKQLSSLALKELEFSPLPPLIAPTLRGLHDRVGQPSLVRSARPEVDPRPLKLGPTIPDQIVYAKCDALFLTQEDPTEPFADYWATHGHGPTIVYSESGHRLVAGPSTKAIDASSGIQHEAELVAAGAESLGGFRPLDMRERNFISNWEAESYRKAVASKPARPLDGRVAVVTGGAQGFGYELAHRLCMDGAHTALLDVNPEQLLDASSKLLEQFPGQVQHHCVDVSEMHSLRTAADALLATWGGVDLLISNAGVLKAGSILEISEEDFHLVTRVNYTGFFLLVRAFLPMMIAQASANPSRALDIVQINSKSGLVGSSRNAAYAGSKFGGIGLVQSFALELAPFNIKVNAICPGNFFDGPLWSNPKTGLFVQYLEAGKVPGAKTIEDVRASYEAKVPMGRGVSPDDVYMALRYIVDQQYETGQAMPVTGGQTMLH